MRHKYAKRLVVITCLFTSVAASAQNSNKENAPYSRYGIGELYYGTNASLRGAGYASTAYSSKTMVNTDNPASYASLTLTTYEAGLMGATRNISTGNTKYGTGSASLAYLNIGIPMGKHAGVAIGLRPQSRVFYNSVDSASVPGIGKTVAQYNGEGGLNYAYIGAAGKYKGFSLGFNFGYMFGTIRNTSRLVNIDTTYVLTTDYTRYTKIGGIYWKGGAQYETPIDNKINLQLGATVTISQDLNADRESYSYGIRNYNGTEQTDTVSYNSEESGKLVLPMSLSFGARVGSDKWSLMADYTHTDWSTYRNYGAKDSLADRTSRFNIGAEYTPNPASVYKYLSKVTYRLGFYYGTDYVKLHNTSIDYYAVTAGASLPFRRSTDRVHLAMEYGQRGTVSNNLIKENFFRFTLGISLNDKWFIKRRYD